MYNGLGPMYVTEPRTTWKMSPGYSSDDNNYDDDTDENLLESGVLSLLVHRPPIPKYSTHQFPNNFLDTMFARILKANLTCMFSCNSRGGSTIFLIGRSNPHRFKQGSAQHKIFPKFSEKLKIKKILVRSGEEIAQEHPNLLSMHTSNN